MGRFNENISYDLAYVPIKQENSEVFVESFYIPRLYVKAVNNNMINFYTYENDLFSIFSYVRENE